MSRFRAMREAHQAGRRLVMFWEAARAWFLNLGNQYGVNPIIFGIIYVGAIPFFTLSLGWLIRNLRRRRPVVLPALSTGFFFISAYLYLLIAGRNVPAWVYLFVAGMILAGIYSTVHRVKAQLGRRTK
jgi:hypothetical protein